MCEAPGGWLAFHKKYGGGDFAGGPVVKSSRFNAGGVGLIPVPGAKIPHVLQPKNQNTKQVICNKFNKPLKMVHIKKRKISKKIK